MKESGAFPSGLASTNFQSITKYNPADQLLAATSGSVNMKNIDNEAPEQWGWGI